MTTLQKINATSIQCTLNHLRCERVGHKNRYIEDNQHDKDSNRNYSRVLRRFVPVIFFRWGISVMCPIIILKLARTVFTSLPSQTLWPNWLDFVQLFKKFGHDRKNKPSFVRQQIKCEAEVMS